MKTQTSCLFLCLCAGDEFLFIKRVYTKYGVTDYEEMAVSLKIMSITESNEKSQAGEMKNK